MLGGIPGTAASTFSASTVDDEATITKKGYINDLYIQNIVKDTDMVIIRYDKETKLAFFMVKNAADTGKPPEAQLLKFAEPAPV